MNETEKREIRDDMGRFGEMRDECEAIIEACQHILVADMESDEAQQYMDETITELQERHDGLTLGER